MQLRLLLTIPFLPITTVLAGGYAGALERVWLFYAYQIDGLNDEKSRTLGWKCKSWDDVANECRKKKGKEQWVECKGTLPGRRCTFSQLLNHVGGAMPKDQLVADKDGNLLDLKDTNPDPEQTAKKVYTHFLNSPTGKVPDYQPYRILSIGDSSYIDSITKVGDVVSKAVADGKKTAENKWLFDRFTDCTSQIKAVRVGDHGKFVIAEAEEKLKANGITVKTETVGTGHSPIDSSKKWETVDWEGTISEAVKSGKHTMEEAEKIITDVKDNFYAGETTASEHRVVIQSYGNVETKVSGC